MAKRTKLRSVDIGDLKVAVEVDEHGIFHGGWDEAHQYSADSVNALTEKIDKAYRRQVAEKKAEEAGVVVGIYHFIGTTRYGPREYKPINVLLRRKKEGGRYRSDILASDPATRKPLSEPLPGSTDAFLPWTGDTAAEYIRLKAALRDAEKAVEAFEKEHAFRFEGDTSPRYGVNVSDVVEKAIERREKELAGATK